MLLSHLLKRVIAVGTLGVIDADDGIHVFSGEAPEPRRAKFDRVPRVSALHARQREIGQMTAGVSRPANRKETTEK